MLYFVGPVLQKGSDVLLLIWASGAIIRPRLETNQIAFVRLPNLLVMLCMY